MEITIRTMEKKDVEAVRQLIPAVFAHLFAQETGRPQHLPLRLEKEILFYLGNNPEGCFLAATAKGKVMGCCFGHIWGETGWLGPMVVAPSYQGRGIGSRLLERGTYYLENSGCKVIGLETMPQTTANVGLYLRNNYYPKNLRIRFYKNMDSHQIKTDGRFMLPSTWSQASAFLEDVKRISREVDPFIDYQKEFAGVYQHDLGKAIFMKEGHTVRGFAIYHEIPATGRIMIKALAAAPKEIEEEEFFLGMMAGMESMLSSKSFRQIVAPVYGEHELVCKVLLENGYQVQHAGVRMFYKKGKNKKDLSRVIHLAQWSG